MQLALGAVLSINSKLQKPELAKKGVLTVFVLGNVYYIEDTNITSMACNFTQTFTGSADAFISVLKTQVETNSGTFTGDTSSGSFTVPVLGADVEGTYTINGQDLDVIINKKPFFASCGAIQKFIASHIPINS
jgi:hypothetical protein